LTTHTVEVRAVKVEAAEELYLFGVSQQERVKNLADPKNIQTNLLLAEEK